MRTTRDIAWLAGLLEGEGCFRAQRSSTPAISLDMTDADVVERAAKVLGVPGAVRGYKRRTVNRKPIWTVNVHGAHAAAWMMTLYTFLGERRRTKIAELLRDWAGHKGPQRSTRGMKRIAKCHPERPVHSHMLCRACYYQEKSKDSIWLEKRRLYSQQWNRARTAANGKNGYRKNNRYLEFNGERLTVTEWAKRLGVTPGMLFIRLRKGWQVEAILSKSQRNHGKSNGSSTCLPTVSGRQIDGPASS